MFNNTEHCLYIVQIIFILNMFIFHTARLVHQLSQQNMKFIFYYIFIIMYTNNKLIGIYIMLH